MTAYVSNGPLSEHSADPVITSRFNNLLHGDIRELKAFLRSYHVPLNDSLRQRLWLESLAKRCNASLPKEEGNGNTANGSETNGLDEIGGIPPVDEKYATAFYLNERGKRTVARLIRRLLTLHPDITYAPPILYPLLALLLHYMDETKAVFCVELLLRQRSGNIYDLPQTKRDWQIMCKMLEAVAVGHAKKMARCLRTDVDQESRSDMFRWMQWLLHLPFVYLVRLLDVYIMEGFKVFLRAGILFLRLLYTHFLQRMSVRPIVNLEGPALSLAAEMHQIMPVDQFMKVMFRGIRRFSRSELDRFYTQFSAHPELLPIVDIPVVSVTPVDFSNLTNPSTMIEPTEFAHIYRWLPQRITLMSHRRVFASEVDGCALRTLYQRCEGLEPTILLVRTAEGDVFGAYCSVAWDGRHKAKGLSFFGTGETFVFTVRPEVTQFLWVGKKSPQNASSLPAHCEWFMAGDNSSLRIGGGDSGEAIFLDEMMEKGRSAASSTFNNRPLAPTSGTDFSVSAVEVIAFE